MKALIVVVIAFLAAVYVFTFVKWKKRKGVNIDTVAEFRQKYLKNKPAAAEKEESSIDSMNQPAQFDYMERDEFIKETTQEKTKNPYKYLKI